MAKYRTLDHPLIQMIAWNPDRPAEWINDYIAMVHATSNAYLVTGDDGDVVINTGTEGQGQGIRAKFEALLGRPLRVAKLIFTQSHPDHIGGWRQFAGPDTEIIVQDNFKRICAERKLLGPFFLKRNDRVLAALVPPGGSAAHWFEAPDPEPLTEFSDEFEFIFSGRHYKLFRLASGEAVDGIGVWLTDEKTLFFGNWAGAIYGALPHMYTARGDRDRSVTRWLGDCERILALAPELLITGHEQPIEGSDRILADLRKLHAAVTYIHDHTVRGMNDQKDLATVLQELKLPPELETAPGRGPAHWYAKTVWEEYAGWFHHELTSELYPTSARSVWADVVSLAGGGQVIADRARQYLEQDDPEKALHLIEMAVEAEPENRLVRETELSIYEALADRTEGRIFDLLGWLEGRIINARAAIAAIN